MDTLTYTLVVLFCAIYLLMAVGVTRLVAVSDFFEPQQKMFQYLIIWLIPILGSAFVVSILMQHIPRRRRLGFISLCEAIVLVAFGASVKEALASDGGVTPEGDAPNE